MAGATFVTMTFDPERTPLGGAYIADTAVVAEELARRRSDLVAAAVEHASQRNAEDRNQGTRGTRPSHWERTTKAELAHYPASMRCGNPCTVDDAKRIRSETANAAVGTPDTEAQIRVWALIEIEHTGDSEALEELIEPGLAVRIEDKYRVAALTPNGKAAYDRLTRDCHVCGGEGNSRLVQEVEGNDDSECTPCRGHGRVPSDHGQLP